MLNAPLVGAEGLYSTVRNVSSSERFFGFLPPHGRRLGAGEEFTFFGNLLTYITSNRQRASLEGALTDGILALVKTPAVILFDLVLDESKMLGLSNGTFVTADPTWGAYSSSFGAGEPDDL